MVLLRNRVAKHEVGKACQDQHEYYEIRLTDSEPCELAG